MNRLLAGLLVTVSLGCAPYAWALSGSCVADWAGAKATSSRGKRSDELIFKVGRHCTCRFSVDDDPVAYYNSDGSITVIGRTGDWVTYAPPPEYKGLDSGCLGIFRDSRARAESEQSQESH